MPLLPLTDALAPPLMPRWWPAGAACPTKLRGHRAIRSAQLPDCLYHEWFELHEWPDLV